jgi:chromosome segregation protein
VMGRDVTQEGVYREQGLARAGADPRVALDSRKVELKADIARLHGSTEQLDGARAKVADLRARTSGAAHPDEVRRMLDAARSAEAQASDESRRLEEVAAGIETNAEQLARDLEVRSREVAEQNAVRHQRELDRRRSMERIESLRRQAVIVGDDVSRLEAGSEERRRHVAESEEALAKALGALPELRRAHEAAETTLQSAENDAPDDEAETAESAKRLVAVEEARIDARLRAGNLEGNLELIAREAELLQARMDEIRSRMPDGVAPEEVPGGKAREREMRALERRLEEIGPTNALAEAEFRELEERYRNLAEQLDDIAAARTDLEDLIAKLREEEESRYEAVFGAVAANFHEYFSQLNPGGRATLRHADGDDGPRSGVEILVQPPRKRLQNVTLLSSGERSLAALAFVLALDEVNPSPFTILDEVDAALDDANVDRFGQMVARLGSKRQFLVITHNHVTMSYASTLYGIHLDESGSSHLVSVRLDDIRKPASSTAAQAG